MADELDNSFIKKTQEILGSIIKKPALTEKSLKKPPFRFLHDVINNVIKTTGFMKGLYTSDELLSDNIKDKESKLAFLQKAIDVLALVTNQPIGVKPTKVVAGHEPQKTNEFLQILGSAIKSKLDSKEAVRKVIEKTSQNTVSNHKERRASVDKKPAVQKSTSEKTHLRSLTKTIDPVKKPSTQTSQSKESTSKKEHDKTRSRSKDSKGKEREKPKEKTRAKREDSKNRDKSDGKKDKPSRQSREPKSNEIEKEAAAAPAEDAPITQNGHLEDSEQAISVQNEGVDSAVELVNGAMLPEDHNDTSDEKPKQSAEQLSPEQVEKSSQEKHRKPSSGHHTRPPSARSKRTKIIVDNTATGEALKDSIASSSTAALELGSQPLLSIDATSRDSASPFPRPASARPSSSRPAPPRIRIRHIVENEEPSVRLPSAKPVENVILDEGHHSEEEDETFVVTEEQSIDKLEPEVVPTSLPAETPEEDRGSLVKQLLETKKDLERGSQQATVRKVEIDKSQMSTAANNRARESSSKELETLRSFIQNVSRTAYPLGRMLDYLQEDVDGMKMELQMWREEHKQNLTALRKEKGVTENILEPLRVQLDDLDQVVQDQLDANSALKATIIRNDERIQRMLAAVKRKS